MNHPLALLIGVSAALLAGGVVSVSAATSVVLEAADTSVVQGDAIAFVALVSELPPSPDGLVIVPYLNGTLWGAPTPVDSLGSASLLIPFARPGSAEVVVVLQDPPSQPFYVGTPMPPPGTPNTTLSNAVTITVKPFAAPPPATGGTTLLMEWEPWFTNVTNQWALGEAVPLVGQYDSFNTDVMRLHCVWMLAAGVDGIVVDWTNNVWGLQNWTRRSELADMLMAATEATMDAYVEFRGEGLHCPAVVLLLGLDNGPVTPPQTLAAEMDYICNTYLPKYPKDMWVWDGGAPLLLVLDSPGINATLTDSCFALRWMSTQLQSPTGRALAAKGFWSWMDGVISPVPTTDPSSGAVEALTVTPAFFEYQGWLGAGAYGRRGGATLAQEFVTVAATKPTYLVFNQWNEFDGQPNGATTYVDCYSPRYSNDIEPTALRLCGNALRQEEVCGGWGFYYVNLASALMAVYRGQDTSSTILTIASPSAYAPVAAGSTLAVEWVVSGITVVSGGNLSVAIDGVVVASGIPPSSNSTSLDISGLTTGTHSLTLAYAGATTMFALSATRLDFVSPPAEALPSSATVSFLVVP